MKFADILTEDEPTFMRQNCANVSIELRECRKIPLPKKKSNYYRKNPEYTKQLKRVQALAEASSELTVTVKETSSYIVLRDSRRKKLEQEDRQAREARRNCIEDIEYYRKLHQFVSSNKSLTRTFGLNERIAEYSPRYIDMPLLKGVVIQGQVSGGKPTDKHSISRHLDATSTVDNFAYQHKNHRMQDRFSDEASAAWAEHKPLGQA
ncbi:hypothetical protein C0989_001460 [Termitomyces sp. Mn162]|nr:hypothetical protein C0989_001460 [Termitomyces sp. Mn162]